MRMPISKVEEKEESGKQARGRDVVAEEGENRDGTLTRKRDGSSDRKELKWQMPKRNWEKAEKGLEESLTSSVVT